MGMIVKSIPIGRRRLSGDAAEYTIELGWDRDWNSF